MGEGFEPGRAVFRLVDVARAKAMQQRAQDAAHMRVVVDDEKAKPVEIDADHDAIRSRIVASGPFAMEVTVPLLRKG